VDEIEHGLLAKAKANLILEHDEDDELLARFIAAAVSYAEDRQHKPEGFYLRKKTKMRPTTEQAVIMLASHFYESRDGGTGGFFTDSTAAARQVWDTVNALLRMNKEVAL